MIRTIEHKLYLNTRQCETLKGWLRLCCWIYNRIKAQEQRWVIPCVLFLLVRGRTEGHPHGRVQLDFPLHWPRHSISRWIGLTWPPRAGTRGCRHDEMIIDKRALGVHRGETPVERTTNTPTLVAAAQVGSVKREDSRSAPWCVKNHGH